MKHTFQSHSSTPNFSFPCGISGCTQTFRTYAAISTHLQRKHPKCDSDGSLLEPIEASTTGSALDETTEESEGPILEDSNF